MLARILSATVLGIEALEVQVEIDISLGMPAFNIVGLPDTAVKEARDRIRSAIKNSDYNFPQKRITANLAPADLKKEGPSFDLPMALGVLKSTGQIGNGSGMFDDVVMVGELGLDGRLRPVEGVLPIALMARSNAKTGIMVPAENRGEALLVEGLKVWSVGSLVEAVRVISGEEGAEPQVGGREHWTGLEPEYEVDFSEVKGQAGAKRALEIAAAGGHNVLLIGPPGSGKTMLARRLPTILPPMTSEEALEVTKIFSIAGMIRPGNPVVNTRPFRSPHHTISNVALVGGTANPKPGEVSLSHHGVLFLDELPEFRRDVLEVLRQPIEDGVVTIARAATTVQYPASFMLVAAMNPCPCGYYGDGVKPCTCKVGAIQRYLQRISGPLLDRIDIHIEIPRPDPDRLRLESEGELSDVIRHRVSRARELQAERFHNTRVHRNAEMAAKHLKRFCHLSDEAEELLKRAMKTMGLSARAYDRIKKLSRTIADLSECPEITIEHVAEAVSLRSLDRKYWG